MAKKRYPQRKVTIDFKNESVLTEQAHKETCDINSILHDYAKTGFMRHAKENKGTYDDVTGVNFMEAQIIVANTKSLFEGLPALVRKEFNHNPAEFLDFVQNPDNAEQLSKRGLLVGNDGLDHKGSYSNALTAEQYRVMLEQESRSNSDEVSSSVVDEKASASAVE